ncbi:MAG TPA: hypothetical protein DHW42_08705 [Candidatus Marinimicrobia bacterium]|nr:hypothetical protein [Candidatus Neomarinimicrobiota bacterium]
MEILPIILVLITISGAVFWLIGTRPYMHISAYGILQFGLSLIYLDLSGELLALVNIFLSLLVIILLIIFNSARLNTTSKPLQFFNSSVNFKMLVLPALIIFISIAIFLYTLFTKIDSPVNVTDSLNQATFADRFWIILPILSMYSMILMVTIKGVLKKGD